MNLVLDPGSSHHEPGPGSRILTPWTWSWILDPHTTNLVLDPGSSRHEPGPGSRILTHHSPTTAALPPPLEPWIPDPTTMTHDSLDVLRWRPSCLCCGGGHPACVQTVVIHRPAYQPAPSG